ncbi:MAG: DUF1573 domain-containing protein [Ferruginibacter sp.]
MKKLILSVAAFTFASVLFAQKTAADVAKFDTETINQGTLKQNDPKEVRFIVTNIGKEPLIIEQANPTCGCTMGDYTKSPIAPGATGFISAKFNAANAGHFDKHLTVKFAGIDELKSITITGDVLTSEDYDKWVIENEAKKKAEAAALQPAPASKTKAKSKATAKNN